MPTDLLAKAAVSAAAVGVLLSLLKQGPRTSGLAAAVPVNSLPSALAGASITLLVQRGLRNSQSGGVRHG